MKKNIAVILNHCVSRPLNANIVCHRRKHEKNQQDEVLVRKRKTCTHLPFRMDRVKVIPADRLEESDVFLMFIISVSVVV